NPVKYHRARARADHREQNQAKLSPAWPPTIVPRRHRHRRQGERQSEKCVGETDERGPLANCWKNRIHLACLALFIPALLSIARGDGGRLLNGPVPWPRRYRQSLEPFGGAHKRKDLPGESSRRPAAAIRYSLYAR